MKITATFQPITDTLQIKRVGYDYIAELSSVPVRFTLSHIIETHGDTKAEIAIDSIQTGNEGLILRDKLTLLSQRGKSALAKSLETRTGQQAAWATHIEAICNAVLEDFRMGEEAIDLASVEASPDQEYLVERLLPLGAPTVLYGDGGSCKSLTGLFLSIAIATHHHLPGSRMLQEPQRVLYLDWEAGAAVHKRRMAKACAGMGIEIPQGAIFYRRMTRGLSDDLRRVKQEVDGKGIGFVVVDSMGAACAGEPESAEVVLRFFGALRELDGVTELVITHITKLDSQLAAVPRPYGNVHTTNQARSTWFCKANGPEEADWKKVAFSHTKVNEGKLFRPLGIRYDFLPDQTVPSYLDPAGDIELSDHLPLSTRISGVLRHGSMTLKELAEELNAKEKSVEGTLRRMEKQGQLTKLGGGKGQGNAIAWGVKTDDSLNF